MIRHRGLLSIATGSLLLTVIGLAPVLAQEPVVPAQQAPIQVPITPTKPAGPQGLAILSASTAGTGVQVLAPGAPATTTAVIQTGTCAAVGTAPVGLVGQLGATGSAQADLPIPLGQLTDGAHVVALHAGMDFTVVLACGSIPAVAAPVPPLPEPDPAVKAECLGVADWVTAISQRLDQVKALQDGLSTTADSSAYLTKLATNIGEVQAIVLALRSEAVPAAATTTNELFVSALEAGVEAASELIQAFTTTDPTLYQQAITKAQTAEQELLKVRTAIAELGARCK